MSFLVDDYDARLAANPAYTEYPAHDTHALPRVGQTRCYWALLSADLQFIYLDPVLQSHLEEQAELLVGKSLLAFVHPDEQASAKQDLGGVLESRNLSGSVTRVRFSRLSKVRRQLGYKGPPSSWPEADKVSLDKDYMAVDIVTNWAADGLVLCFIHATVDLTPNDNNENLKTPWSNWCGTPQMSTDQIELLYHRLVVCLRPPPTTSRVFQILANQGNRPLLMSWPPDLANGPSRTDFAELVKKVKIDTVAAGNDAKTSCTRRYQALQNMPAEFGGEVESIFLPHGAIIFACHKVNPTVRSNGATSSLPMQSLEYAPQGFTHQQNAWYYEHGAGAPYSLPPLNTQTQSYSSLQQQPANANSAYSSPRWAQDTASAQSNQQWANDNGPPTAAYLDASQQPFSNRPISPAYNYPTAPAGNSGPGETSPAADVVPPPRRRISPSASRETGPIRTNSNRPTGIQKCSSCKATSSPEWRKGPSGKKELCNACGLRYARSRAKKEGPNQTQQRRRKEKVLVAKRDSMEPSPAFNPRRSYGDTSFSSTGSASGSEIYPHTTQPQPRHSLENLTPSPSPPGSNMNFVHYAPGANDTRSSYSSGGMSNFYPTSVPSPLSSQQVLHPHTSQQQQPTVPSQHPHMNNTQLPPLGQLSAYAGRLSPLVPPPTSSLSSSGIGGASHLHASYEREVRDSMASQRDREAFRGDLPPTPLSAEPRIAPRRSILTQQ